MSKDFVLVTEVKIRISCFNTFITNVNGIMLIPRKHRKANVWACALLHLLLAGFTQPRTVLKTCRIIIWYIFISNEF